LCHAIEQLDEARVGPETIESGIKPQPHQPVRPLGKGPVKPGKSGIDFT
jgi:hypothetical protein